MFVSVLISIAFIVGVGSSLLHLKPIEFLFLLACVSSTVVLIDEWRARCV